MMKWLAARIAFLPTLAWNMLLGRVLRLRYWWDAIDESVIVGAFPFTVDAARLADEGVGGVVNTCEEYAGPVRHTNVSKYNNCAFPPSISTTRL